MRQNVHGFHLSDLHVPLLTACIIVAAFLRLFLLDYRGLWLDEAEWLRAISVPRFADTFKAGNFPHTPFFAVMMWPFRALLFSDTWARLIPALFGVATVPVLYSIGARLFNRRVALLAAGLLALCPIHIDYSRQIEPYPIAVFLVTVTVLSILRAGAQPSVRRWAAAIALAALSVYASIFAVIVFAVISLVVFLGDLSQRGLKRAVIPWTCFWAGIAAVYLPFFIFAFLFRPRVYGLGSTDRFITHFPIDYGWFDRAQLICSGIWRDDRIELTIPLLVCLAALSLGLLGSFRHFTKGTFIGLAWAGAAAAIVLVCYLQRYAPTGRYFMTALPGLCLFLSASVYCLLSNRLKRRPLRYALRAATALLFLPLLYWNIGAVAAYFFAPPPEDHKYLLKALQATARATDKIICADGNSAVFLARYAPTLQSAAEIVELGSFPDSILDTVGQSRVWLVYRSPKASSLDAAIQKRGLSHLDLSVRGKNTGLVLVWPKGVTRETVLSDAMAIHSQVLAFAGPNRGNVLLALGENAKRSQDKTAEETAGIFARAINPLRRLSLINPTDASAHLALATAYENVANYSAAARAYSRALLLSSTPGAAFRIGENLVLCLNDGRVNQPGIPSPRGIVQRLALRRLDTIDLLSNGSFERCDGTGRPLGWAMATPEALATIPSNVSPADGAQFAVLRSTPSYWAFLGYTLPACPALFAGNGLSVTVYAQAPATDLMFLSVDMKSNGKDVSLARKAWPQSDGKWIPLTLEVDAIPTLEQATLRVRVTVRNVPDRTCLIDNASAYLKRAK